MCRAVSGKVPNDPLVPDDSLIHDNLQGGACCAVFGKVPDDYWVPDDPLVPNDPWIHDDRQGRACHVLSRSLCDR